MTLSGNVRIWNPLRRGLRYACDRSRDRRGYLSGARGGPTSRGPRGGLASLLVGPRKKTRDNRGTGTTHAESLTSQADTRTMDGLVQNPNKRPGTDLRKFYRAAPILRPATRTRSFLARSFRARPCEMRLEMNIVMFRGGGGIFSKIQSVRLFLDDWSEDRVGNGNYSFTRTRMRVQSGLENYF